MKSTVRSAMATLACAAALTAATGSAFAHAGIPLEAAQPSDAAAMPIDTGATGSGGTLLPALITFSTHPCHEGVPGACLPGSDPYPSLSAGK
ncbi:hypothetical protein [Nocardia mexicana]|uniref:Small secreted domain DUF320 n=1 Tax=Nocardia mexicana TaxID=279262 RepID=A0A370GHH0_9NOCA|nr:hypothetical protein [Nocardia mexicana]RDI43245.1 hypothetical protein DFR68_1227 [Nocardia mexicana]